MKITEEWIISQAPNSSAVQNGKKLSQKGSFSSLGKTDDDTLFWGDCAGSGKNPYHTSIDFTNEAAPTCRCSCPSRQFPCKHAIGLMFEILNGKTFAVSEVPQDLAEKRAKKAARDAKKEENKDKPISDKPKKINNSAKIKKINKQLEGIEKAEQMLSDLIFHGLNTLTGASVKSYEKLAKDLSSYYLTGAEVAFYRLANEIEHIQKNPEKANYNEAIRILIKLNALLQKSRVFLEEKLEKKEYDVEDNLLYEALGGIWKLDELEKIGSMKENAELVQLSFDVYYDEAKKEYVDRGYWIELESGEIHQTLNYRPIKALKYIKADDSCFDKVNTPKLFYYPGTGNRRIRWDSYTMENIEKSVYEQIFDKAKTDVTQLVKEVKNEIKGTLSEKYLAVAVAFDKLGKINDEFVLQAKNGEKIVLRDIDNTDNSHLSTYKLETLPNPKYKNHQALFGLMFYDANDSRICMQPFSLITKESIIRLQY